LVIHDSDVVFGMASRMLSSRAQVIATGFPTEAFAGLPQQDKMVFTGNPVRTELLTSSEAKAQKTFEFQHTKPIVFILCGSQGAGAINDVIFGGLELITKHYNVIHHTGTQGIEQARVAAHRLPQDLQQNYRPYEFLQSELADALFIADAVVVRPSASVIAEVAAHSKPTLLIPSPHSANNHSQKNAEFLERMGAARILNQSDLTAIRLCAELDRLLAGPKAKQYLQKSIHEFWVSDSAARIAKLIVANAKNSTETSQ
jgi:UDP-N-acetylglucosamine--N-acetylmuramyl-(pentapeptide) pyrophosphoryl-undecaprenol N-acetylglucosamine transferase